MINVLPWQCFFNFQWYLKQHHGNTPFTKAMPDRNHQAQATCGRGRDLQYHGGLGEQRWAEIGMISASDRMADSSFF